MTSPRYSVFVALNDISDEAILEAELPAAVAAAPLPGETLTEHTSVRAGDRPGRSKRSKTLLPLAGWIAAALCVAVVLGLIVAVIRGGGFIHPFRPPSETTTSPGETADEPTEELPFEVWDGSVASGFAGGQGTSSDPYIIDKPSQLAYLAKVLSRKDTTYAAKYYRLEANLDMYRIDWTPIGTGDLPFKGHFDGNGHIIRNLSVKKLTSANGYHVAGLFGVVKNAVIQDLTVTDVIILVKKADASYGKVYAGGLAGIILVEEDKTVTLTDCSLERVKVSVECAGSGTTNNYQGGVTGRMDIEEGGRFRADRLQAVEVTLYGKSSKNLYQGILTGYTECHARFELRDVCLEGTVGYKSTAGDHFYAGVSGAFHSDGGKSACKNVFAVCNNAQSSGHIFSKKVYVDLSKDPSFSFENCFMGHTDGSGSNPPGNNELLYYGDGEGISYRNCLYTVALPKNHGFSEEIWDLRDMRHPRLR